MIRREATKLILGAMMLPLAVLFRVPEAVAVVSREAEQGIVSNDGRWQYTEHGNGTVTARWIGEIDSDLARGMLKYDAKTCSSVFHVEQE